MARVDVKIVGEEQLGVCHEIRERVFVQGQGVPKDVDRDGLDGACVQFLAREGGTPLGTARLREVEGVAKAERVAVVETERSHGIGRALMEELEREAGRRGAKRVILNAQEDVVPFYERLGYTATGPRFIEANIWHRPMKKEI